MKLSFGQFVYRSLESNTYPKSQRYEPVIYDQSF